VSDTLERLTAALADSYEIQHELGAGGMATVYLARDLKHDRLVAVKVLHPDLAASLGHERFLREIQVTAKLSHPHILPLYDSGEAGGFLFYVMAEALGHAHAYGLVHRDIKPANIMLSGGHAVVADFGIALAVTEAGGEKLTQTGTAIGTAIYMSPEQAMGLENIDGRSDIYSLGCMLYEMLVGQVPFTGPNPQAIMARHTMDAVSPPSIIRQTITPELEDIIFAALAKSPADRFRTAGELAEALNMLDSGTLAQQRYSRASTMARTAHTEALERTGRGRRMPRKAIAAISAVAAVGIGFGIWQLWPGGSGGPVVAGDLEPSNVAVLYFDDLSPAGDLGHVADGLTEGLIDQLTQVRVLDVVSRNGVAQFRGSDVPRDSIARALGAGSIVIGSVEPEGDNLRVTTRLVDGESAAEFSRASFTLPADELLLVMDSVTQDVSRILRERLGEEVRTREIRAGTGNVEAWALVQRAERLRKEAEALVSADDVEAAESALQRADTLLARAEAADREWIVPTLLRGWIAHRHSRFSRGFEALPWVEAGAVHAEDALAREPNDPEALALRGSLRYRHWRLRITDDPDEWQALLDGAREDLEAAVQADPSLTDALVTLSFVYYQYEDVASALMAARRAYEEDAYLEAADNVLNRLFWGSLDLEDFRQGRRWCAEGARRFPEDHRFAECHLWLMATPAQPADADEAWRLADRLETLAPEPQRDRMSIQGELLVGGILGRAGLADSGKAVLSRARARTTAEIDPTHFLWSVEAYMRTQVDDDDEAIELLKRYVAANPEHDWAGEAGASWWWVELRGHPRWSEIVGPGR
jgi:serine/threonine-protein kinase